MKHLYEAARILEDQGIGEIGVSLFVGRMPEGVFSGIALKDPLYGAEIDEGQDGFFEHEFLVISTNKDPEIGYDAALQASEVLKVENYQGDGIFLRKVYPLALPSQYPMMDSDLVETAVRMRVWFSLR